VKAIATIARNTLSEAMRQNAYGALLAGGALLIATSPLFAMFTFMDSTKLVQDMGLATILLVGLFLGVFAASTVVSEEIEGRTALTVLAKPVSRESFILGKYIGILAAIALAVGMLTIVLMLTYRFGVKDRVSTELDWISMVGIVLSVLIGFVVGGLVNYFFGRPFLPAAIWTIGAMLVLTLLFLCFRDKDGEFSGFGADINWQIALAAILALEAIAILTAIAVAASTRLRAGPGLAAVAVAFLLGLVSEFLFGRHTDVSALARVAYAVIPDMQVFWVTEGLLRFADYDSALKDPGIPASYIGMASTYALSYVGATLLVGMALFRRREVRQ
jgi:ABC-type transport system involved in multi-copper enzyme maturation permease subunit